MRRVSKKRARLNRAAKPLRDEYKFEYQKCEVFSCSAQASELHEITRGQHRSRSLDQPASWLHLCHDCHVKMGLFTVTQQLALKKLSNSGYDRRAVNTIRNPKTPDAITEEEVDQQVKWFQEAPLANVKAQLPGRRANAVTAPSARE